jgi:uncharacterized protein YcfJ
MNIKAWIATSSVSLVLALSTAPAMADHEYGNGRSGAMYDYARVIRSEPIIRYVTVRTPYEECWTDTEYYTVTHRPRGTAGGAIIGAIIGGVIGHQIGHGHHRDDATVLGSLAGAAIGSEAAIARNGGYETTQHSRPVRRCATNYSVHEEERIDGYRVTYVYNGQKYATRMPNDPGKRLRIRVDVRPVS